MIKHIIFDLGGVIIKHKHDVIERILTKMFPDSSSLVYKLWQENRTQMMNGTIDSYAFLRTVKDAVESQEDEKNLHDMWKNYYIEEAQDLNTELLDLIKILSKQYTVYLFTDTIDIHDEYNSTRGIYDLFERVIISYKEKITKNDPDVFSIILQKIGVRADETLYIDDLKVNVEKAEEAGISGIVFENTPQLKNDLNQLDVKTGE